MSPDSPIGPRPVVVLNAAALARLQHDLRTPLTVIMGHTQLLRRRMPRLDRLSPEDRDWLVARTTAIDAAVMGMMRSVAGIDRLALEALSEDDVTGNSG